MNTWCVLIVSHGGSVSMIRALGEDEAKKLAGRLTPQYQSGVMYSCNDGDLVRVEAFDASQP